MDHDLLVTRHRLSTVKAAKLFGVPVVHSTVMWPVAKGRLSPELGVGDVVGCPGAADLAREQLGRRGRRGCDPIASAAQPRQRPGLPGTGGDVPREMVTERHLS